MRVLARGIEDARNVTIRANSIGLSFSAALAIGSATVRTAGMLRSDVGMVLTRCTIASAGTPALRRRAVQSAGRFLAATRSLVNFSRMNGSLDIGRIGSG